MKISIITFGKLKEKFFQDTEAEYLKRFSKNEKIEFIELSPAKFTNTGKNKKIEAELYFKKVPGNSFKIILDETGKLFTSKDLAEFIQQKQISSVTHLCFAIGGAAGWDPSVLKNSDLTLSLSKLTFPHQIARILLVEQIYRARSILKGTNYHK